MDDYKNSDNFQRTEGRKMISPHHFYPANGVGPSDSYGYHYNFNAGKETPANYSEYYSAPDSAPVWKQFGGRL